MKDKPNRELLVVPQGGAKRNTIDREKDIHWAVAEVAKGRTYSSITKELNSRNDYSISAEQVRKDIESALVEWKRENMDNIEVHIAKELHRLDALEAKVMAEYEKSKALRPADYAQLMKRGYTIEEIDEIYDGKGGLAGNPAYIDTLLRIQAQRLRLLGIDKGNDVGTMNVVNYNFGDASLDDLVGIANALQDRKSKEIESNLVD